MGNYYKMPINVSDAINDTSIYLQKSAAFNLFFGGPLSLSLSIGIFVLIVALLIFGHTDGVLYNSMRLAVYTTLLSIVVIFISNKVLIDSQRQDIFNPSILGEFIMP